MINAIISSRGSDVAALLTLLWPAGQDAAWHKPLNGSADSAVMDFSIDQNGEETAVVLPQVFELSHSERALDLNTDYLPTAAFHSDKITRTIHRKVSENVKTERN